MKKRVFIISGIISGLFFLLQIGAPSSLVSTKSTSESTAPTSTPSGEVIFLAGGCFWCSEAYLQETPGVLEVISGYAGGDAETAEYTQVVTGQTQHREAVQVIYDAEQITLDEILDVYWQHIDPTDAGGQFADRGYQYQTAIYYQSAEEQKVIEESKRALANSGLFDKPIATEILPFSTFFPAEEYHQDYYKKASLRYELYKKGSGRAGFIEDNWAREAALEYFSSENRGS